MGKAPCAAPEQFVPITPTMVSSAATRCAADCPPSAEQRLSSTTSSISRPKSIPSRPWIASSIPPWESSPKKDVAPDVVNIAPTTIGSSAPTTIQPSSSAHSCANAGTLNPTSNAKSDKTKNRRFIC